MHSFYQENEFQFSALFGDCSTMIDKMLLSYIYPASTVLYDTISNFRLNTIYHHVMKSHPKKFCLLYKLRFSSVCAFTKEPKKSFFVIKVTVLHSTCQKDQKQSPKVGRQPRHSCSGVLSKTTSFVF